MAPLLSEFPFELLQRIIVFAGSDVKTFLRCETTCRAFRNVVVNDKTWEAAVPAACRALMKSLVHSKHNEFTLKYFKSCREWASVTFGIANVYWNQVHSSENVFAHYLGADGFETFIQGDPRSNAPENFHVCKFLEGFAGINIEFNRFVFRRDTLETLAEIVQHTMISILSRAHDVSCAVASAAGTFPIMTEQDFSHGNVGFVQLLLPTGDDGLVDALLRLVPEVTRDAIVRLLSHRAGVVRMTNKVYKLAWATLVHTILLLIRPACVEMVGTSPREHVNGKRVLSANESIRTVPPHSVTGTCTEHKGNILIHKIVPQQVQDAAKRLGLVHTVYGDFWFIDVHESDEDDLWTNVMAAMGKAEEDYEFQEESDEEEEEDLNMDCYEKESGLRSCAVLVGALGGQELQQDSASEPDSDLEEEDEEDSTRMSLPAPRDSMEVYDYSETMDEAESDETGSENDNGSAMEDFVDQFESADMIE